MPDRFSAGSSFKHGAFVLPLVLSGLLLAAGPFLVGRSPLAPGLIAAGGALLLVAVVAGCIIYRGRRWVEPAADGFTVTSHAGSRAVKHGEVEKLALAVVRNESAGVTKSFTHRLKLWVGDGLGGAPIVITHKQSLKKPDRFGPFLEKVFSEFHRRSREAIERGRELEGEGWKLRRDALVVEVEGSSEQIRLEDITGVDRFDGRLCVWKRGTDQASFRVRLESVNVPVLGSLLAELMPAHPAKEAVPSEDGLGRLLFERRGKWRLAAGLALLAAAAIPVLLHQQATVAASVTAGIGLLLGCTAFHRRSTVFCCHEHGIASSSAGSGRRVILYKDLATFTYSATRMYVEGAYAGTSTKLEFVERAEAGGRKIRFCDTIQKADEELERLREEVSRIIASGMQVEARAGRPVPWTRSLTFQPQGIEYRRSGLLGRGAPILVPFSEITRFAVNQGQFHLWVRGRPKPVVRERVCEPNFFPGFVLFQWLGEAAQAPPGVAGEAAAEVVTEPARTG